MLVADEYLRNRASIASRNHFLARLRVVLDIDFAQLHILLSQQPLGSLAVRTPVRYVHRHCHGGGGHFLSPPPPAAGLSPRTLSLFPPFNPPRAMNTPLKPSATSPRVTPAPLPPRSQ